MLYRQLILLLMDYACQVWIHAADSHMKRLLHVDSKCLRTIAGAPWHLSNLQPHEDLEVPYIAENISNLSQNLDSKTTGAENLLVLQLGRYLIYPRDV